MAEPTLPTLDFSTFIVSLSHSALMHLGDAVEGVSGDSGGKIDLPMARQTIDILEIIHTKTKGNLTGAEERLLDQILNDLRLRFVEVSQQQS